MPGARINKVDWDGSIDAYSAGRDYIELADGDDEMLCPLEVLFLEK